MPARRTQERQFEGPVYGRNARSPCGATGPDAYVHAPGTEIIGWEPARRYASDALAGGRLGQELVQAREGVEKAPLEGLEDDIEQALHLLPEASESLVNLPGRPQRISVCKAEEAPGTPARELQPDRTNRVGIVEVVGGESRLDLLLMGFIGILRREV
jgi:hypothetical protein